MARLAAALALVTALVPVVGATPFGGGAVQAQSTSVVAWATLGSVAPAVGCSVDASVEVRDPAGSVLPDVEVGVALVLDGDVLAADRGFTGGDGIAYLAVDTSAGTAGREAWLDVLIGGDYSGGMPVALTDDGGCAGEPRVVELAGSAPAAHSAETSDGWSEPGTPVEAPAAEAGSPGVISFWVPAYHQQRGLSCEYASLVIAMAHFGVDVSEYAFDDVVGWSQNPHWGFRGNIDGAWGSTDDYGVYAEALSAALPAFGFWGDAFYGQGDASALTSRLDNGYPTLVWLGLWGDTGFYDYLGDGTAYKLAAGQHVMVAYGYDDGGVYLSDPGTGQYVYYSWPSFMDKWSIFDGMSLAVGPS